MFQIILSKNVAIGNGDRKSGEVLATSEKDPRGFAGDDLRCSSLAELEANTGLEVNPAEGVEELEIITALVNVFCSFREEKNGEAPEAPPEAVEVAVAEAPEVSEAEEAESQEIVDLVEGVSLDALDLGAGTLEKLIAAGLDTVAKVVEFGTANKGLQSIDGIGPGIEEKIRDAILAAADAEGDDSEE